MTSAEKDQFTIPSPSRSRIITGLVAAATITLGLSIAVGYAGPGKAFGWDLASVFGTAVGTTLLALATFWLSISTYQDVRASQQLAVLSTEQLELSRDANELARSEQRERLDPAVIASSRGGASGGAASHLNVQVVNVGGGPAVRVEIGAVYGSADDPRKPDPAVGSVNRETIPYLAPGATFDIALNFNRTDVAREISFERFRVVGSYLDRQGRPAGNILDWRHEALASD
jgi:hypothetical protein